MLIWLFHQFLLSAETDVYVYEIPFITRPSHCRLVSLGTLDTGKCVSQPLVKWPLAQVHPAASQAYDSLKKSLPGPALVQRPKRTTH